jgi:hypothetical protein
LQLLFEFEGKPPHMFFEGVGFIPRNFLGSLYCTNKLQYYAVYFLDCTVLSLATNNVPPVSAKTKPLGRSWPFIDGQDVARGVL